MPEVSQRVRAIPLASHLVLPQIFSTPYLNKYQLPLKVRVQAGNNLLPLEVFALATVFDVRKQVAALEVRWLFFILICANLSSHCRTVFHCRKA